MRPSRGGEDVIGRRERGTQAVWLSDNQNRVAKAEGKETGEKTVLEAGPCHSHWASWPGLGPPKMGTTLRAKESEAQQRPSASHLYSEGPVSTAALQEV